MAVVNVRGTDYYIHNGLKKKWDSIKDGKLAQKDEDRVYVVDGRERSGKSLFSIQQVAYIDPTILDDEDEKILPRICFSSKEVLYAIRNTRSTKSHTKVIIFDEAFRGMSSKSALSQENKRLVQAMMEMGQFNLVLFIVSPSFFLLEMYPAVLRSNALFHIKKDKKSQRRIFKVYNYNKKAMLYQIGIRKGWGYPIGTKQKGNFFNKYPGGDAFEIKYRKKKADSLKETNKEETKIHRWQTQRDTLLKILHEQGLSYSQIVEILKDKGIPISKGQISNILLKNKEKDDF